VSARRGTLLKLRGSLLQQAAALVKTITTLPLKLLCGRLGLNLVAPLY
jgi:hypothetical protein